MEPITFGLDFFDGYAIFTMLCRTWFYCFLYFLVFKFSSSTMINYGTNVMRSWCNSSLMFSPQKKLWICRCLNSRRVVTDKYYQAQTLLSSKENRPTYFVLWVWQNLPLVISLSGWAVKDNQTRTWWLHSTIIAMTQYLQYPTPTVMVCGQALSCDWLITCSESSDWVLSFAFHSR